nr:MAG TPA: hypothetical protein [Herelleviridae sp.]
MIVHRAVFELLFFVCNFIERKVKYIWYTQLN